MKLPENIKPIWIDKYTIHSFHADANKKAKLSSLFGFMQETAWHHAENLGVGFHQLKEVNMLWVLAKLYIEVERYPEWNEKISLETWPKGIDRLYALRDFYFKDEQGKIIARASTYWIIINYETRRPQKLDFIEKYRDINKGLFAIELQLDKLKSINSESSKSIQVVYADLDMNLHVNNSRYLDWMLDSFTTEQNLNEEVASVQIDFQQEIKPDESLTIHKEKAQHENEWNFTGTNLSANKTSFNAALKWKPSQP